MILMLNQFNFGLIIDGFSFFFSFFFFQAVQEFTGLCKNSTVDAVESALPFWPRLFNKLAMVRSDDTCALIQHSIYISKILYQSASHMASCRL